MGKASHGLDASTVEAIAADLASAARLGVETAVVVGGGNFFRGIAGAETGIERARADSIGMLATVMNALAMEYAIEKQGQAARALSAVAMPSLCEPYSRQAALHHLGKGRVVVLAGGTGNPFFTTDTGAALRAAELSADVILKATQVDGVYSADPKRDPAARRYETLTHDEAIAKNFAIMDTAAFALARETKIPIFVFSIKEPRAICAVLQGQRPGDARHALTRHAWRAAWRGGGNGIAKREILWSYPPAIARFSRKYVRGATLPQGAVSANWPDRRTAGGNSLGKVEG